MHALSEGTPDNIGRALSPPGPDTDEAKLNALRLKVMSNYPTKNTVLGYVFVPSFSPFLGYGTEDTVPQIYHIWGPMPGGRGNKGMSSSNVGALGNLISASSFEAGYEQAARSRWRSLGLPRASRDPRRGSSAST